MKKTAPCFCIFAPPFSLARPLDGDLRVRLRLSSLGPATVAVVLVLMFAFATPSAAQNSPAWVQLNPTPDPTYGSPGARDSHTAVYNPSSNRMIVFGGAQGFTLFNDVWILTNADGTTGKPAWIRLNPAGGPSSRMLHQAVYDSANNLMIVQGGYTQPGQCAGVVGDTWVLTNADGTGGSPAWMQLPTGPALRSGTLGYDSADNILVLWGGQPSGCGREFDTTWVLTYANGIGGTGQWTQLTPTNTITSSGNVNGPGGYDPHTRVFIGVATDNGSYPDRVRLLSGAAPVSSPAWTDLISNWGTPQYATSPPAGVYDPTKNIILTCCGFDGSLPAGQQVATETWVLNYANGQGGTASWTETNPTGTLPPPRTNNSLVYNSTSNRMLIFGGVNPYTHADFGDVWVLTGAGPATPTSTTITSSANPSDTGDPVTFMVGLTSPPGSSCSGSVTLSDGSTVLATLGGPFVASFTTNSLAAGAHTIIAQFTPSDPASCASSSASLVETIVSFNQFPMLNGNNTFTGNQLVNGKVTAASFAGNGSGLTNVTASALNCAGCVTNSMLTLNYAAGDSQAGNALNALMFAGMPPSAFAPASGSGNYVAKSGDAMTGNLSVPTLSIGSGVASNPGDLAASGAVSGASFFTTNIVAPHGNPANDLNISGDHGINGVIRGGDINISAGYGTGNGGDVLISGGPGGQCSYCGYSRGGNIMLTPGDFGHSPGDTGVPGTIQLNGNTTVGGTLTATSFSGGGTGLTNVNAASAASLTGNISDTQVTNLSTDLANASASAVSTSEAYTNSTVAHYVAKSGDTMTGALNLPAINAVGSGVNSSTTIIAPSIYIGATPSPCPTPIINPGGTVPGQPPDCYTMPAMSVLHDTNNGSSEPTVSLAVIEDAINGRALFAHTTSNQVPADGSGTIAITALADDPGGVGVIGIGSSTATGASPIGVFGISNQGTGVNATSVGTQGVALRANALGSAGIGLVARANSSQAVAGEFYNQDPGGLLIAGFHGFFFNPSTQVFSVDAHGNLNASGAVTAASFTGNGSGLTNVAATTATSASSVNCTGCVGNAQLGITYAGSSSQGGAATSAISAVQANNALALGGVGPSGYAPAAGSANYIQNNPATPQSASLNISGAASIGSNATVTGNLATAGSVVIGSGTAITKHLSILVTPTFAALKPGACATQSFPLTGAVDGDTIALGVPNERMTGGGNIMFLAWVSAANTITLQACNANINVPQKNAGSGSIRVDLWKH